MVGMMNRRSLMCGIGATSLLGLSACNKRNMASLRYASPSLVWWNAVPYFADKMGLYEKNGIIVNQFDVATGTKSKKAVVDKNAEMGVAAPNSFSVASKEELASLKIVANTMESDSTVSIILTKEVVDWSKQTIATVKGTIAEFYLISYLKKIGQLKAYTDGSINFIYTSPAGVANALNNGEATVGVVWEPIASALAAKVSNRALVIRDSDLYTQQIYLLSTKEYMVSHSDEVAAMKKSFKQACTYISTHRKDAATQLEKASGFEPGYLFDAEPWRKTDFVFSDNADDMREAMVKDFEIAKIANLARVDDFSAIEQVLPG